jgi:hypothetical protein
LAYSGFSFKKYLPDFSPLLAEKTAFLLVKEITGEKQLLAYQQNHIP